MAERSSDNDVIKMESPSKVAIQTSFQENSDKVNTCEYLEGLMQRLHSSFLFCRDPDYRKLCEDTFRIIITRIGGTHPMLPGWRDLATNLDITDDKLDYIEYSMKTCPTETILKIFVQQQNATMDKLISALVKIGRYDVISGIYENLTKLYGLLFSTESKDSGYSSTSWSDKDSKTINAIQPNYIPTGLPEVLMPLEVNLSDDVKNNTPGDDNEFQHGLSDITQPFLLLTYADDGIECVKNITKEIELIAADINVVTLNKISEVENSPELLIPILCEKALYIIPILTIGYLDKINSVEEVMPSSMDNKDDAYARYVYTQMTSEYISATGCLNKKVRSILPEKESKNVLKRLHHHSVLRVWTAEKDLTKFLKRLGIS